MQFKPAILIASLLANLTAVSADWPMLRGTAEHTGFLQVEIKRPFRLAWATEFPEERLGTAMEPIVAEGRVYVATHGGNLYALDANSGEALWRFEADGPFLHSPAVAQGIVVAASTDDSIHAVQADNGQRFWRQSVGSGGCSAAPVIANDMVFVATRAGEFLALDLRTGRSLWKVSIAAPIRQTAACSDDKIFVTAEDLRVRCLDLSGKLLWVSEQLSGQTARDYYPILVKSGGRTFVIVRTNPVLNMGQRIGRDRTMLCRNAGVDDSGWQKIEAWIKSEASHGTPELWAKEQRAISEYLQTNRDAQTFFVLDANTGKEAFTAPVLWIAGCQGVGAQPALTADGRLLVFYRSAYGNWNHGVAPLVTLGLYNLAKNEITPLFHQQGKKPSWNCFWGTADESQNFLVVGDTALIVHQGNLSGFDLKRNELFPIFGQRDTYGSFRSPPWARNEWHGPGRAGVAVVNNRIYWQTGSRILCLVSGESGPPAKIASAKTSERRDSGQHATAVTRKQISRLLNASAQQIISQKWAPLFIDSGLAGRDFSFDDSSELLEALSWAYPHLQPDLQARVKKALIEELTQHAPYTAAAFYSLKEGEAREWYRVPESYRARLGGDKQPHPFGGLYSAWLFAERCDEKKRIADAFPEIKKSFESFESTKWKLDPAKGDLFANRYLAALLVYARLAKSQDDPTAERATALGEQTSAALIAWWKRGTGTLTNFNTSVQLDPFINSGDAISFRIAPHRHKIALFQDLTPEVAAIIGEKAPEAVDKVWQIFERLYCTWYIVGEERQVHFGENFVDPPDLALNGFKALAWLRKSTNLNSKVDLPFCRADLYYATKLALTLEPNSGL